MNAVIYKIKLRVGDTVMVRSGSQKGRTGKVSAVHPRLNKVTVDGINVVKRHTKPNKQYPKGAIIEKIKPIAVGKVGIIHPTDKKRTSRIGYVLKKDGKKARVYRQAANKEIHSPKLSRNKGK